jgi:hypothetical protein
MLADKDLPAYIYNHPVFVYCEESELLASSEFVAGFGLHKRPTATDVPRQMDVWDRWKLQ